MEPWVALLFGVSILYIIVTGRAETTINLLVAATVSLGSGTFFSKTAPTTSTPQGESRDYTPQA